MCDTSLEGVAVMANAAHLSAREPLEVSIGGLGGVRALRQLSNSAQNEHAAELSSGRFIFLARKNRTW